MMFSYSVWGEYVGVAAVNCVVDRNWPLCRDHRITGFPMVVVSWSYLPLNIWEQCENIDQTNLKYTFTIVISSKNL